MKYIVAVKYKDPEDLSYKTEIFEFNSEEDRSEFVNDIKGTAEEIAFSQIDEVE